MKSAPYWIAPDDDTTPFPPATDALDDPNGLLALGGSLSQRRLLNAYYNGIFPWYSDSQPVLWWSPDPRSVLFPDELKISRSLRQKLRKHEHYQISFDCAFEEVIKNCAQPRPDDAGTWIDSDMMNAYIRLYETGHAHSAECYIDGELAGGLYGVAIGRMFFGESMFSLQPDASKIALVYLVRQLQQWQFGPIDCQIHSAHLQSLGARKIPRTAFLACLSEYRDRETVPAPWRLEITAADVL
jgi:leucyl/phenylalanyl-tRNA--protein transferase